MLIGLSLLDPLGGVGQDIVGWIGRSISQGIGGFASWAIGGVIHAMQSTTTPDFNSWFKGPWRAMLTVVAWLSVPVLFIGVGTAALKGDLTSVLKRGLGAPVIMALGTAVALPVTAGVLTLVNACCSLLVNQALGGNQGFGQGLDHLSNFALSATVTTGGSSLPGLAAALVIALAGLAALVIWFVLALRGALLYLEVLAIPLALIGLYWGGTAHWIKRLVDLIIATIISQLVITMLMVLAAADLNSGQLSATNPGAVGGDMTTLFLCLAFLILGSLALPMALRHVPAATEHAAATAAMISAPGRMTYRGSRAAGTAKMMGGSGGSKALVEAGAAAGPVGVAATAGVGAAAGAAKAGAKAATDAAEGANPGMASSSAGSEAGAGGSSGSLSPGGRMPGSAPGAAGAGRPSSSQASPGQRRSPAGPPSSPGSPGGSDTPGPVGRAASRGSRTAGPSTPKAPGGSRG
jgi:type IV secretion system protein TrbL